MGIFSEFYVWIGVPSSTAHTASILRLRCEMVAQSLIEYSALASMASGVQRLIDAVGMRIDDFTPTTWVIVAIVVLGLVVWSCR
jgi:hypothetical protein